MDRYRARRGWVRATLAVLAAGVAISSALAWYASRAEQRAVAAAETAQLVSDFLNRDLLIKANPREGLTKDSTIVEVLDRAAATVDARFADRPEARARIHLTLGEAYFHLSQWDKSKAHMATASTIFSELGQSVSDAALKARQYEGAVVFNIGGLAKGIAMFEDAISIAGPGMRDHPRVLTIAAQRATWLPLTPQFTQAEREIRELLPRIRASRMPQEDKVFWDQHFAISLAALGYPQEAEPLLDGAVNYYRGAKPGSEPLALALQQRGSVMTALNRLEAAERDLTESQSIFQRVIDVGSGEYAGLLHQFAVLRLEQGRLEEADAMLQQALAILQRTAPESIAARALMESVAQLRRRQGRLAEARSILEQLAAIAPDIVGSGHWATVLVRGSLADVLRRQGRPAEAREIVRGTDTSLVKAQTLPHYAYAELLLVDGLLLKEERKAAEARAAFTEALRINEAVFGAGHPRSVELRGHLAGLAEP